MEVDIIYIKPKQKSTSQTQLRLQNDLIEITKNRMSTNIFDIQISDIIRDEVNELFSMNLILSTSQNSFHFLIIFSRDYPFSPPFVKVLDAYNTYNKIDITDAYGNVKLKFLKKEFWSPILSLNSIIFAIELIIIEPDEANFNLSSLDLYKREEIFFLEAKSKFCYQFSSNPKIVDRAEVSMNDNAGDNNLFKKRKFSQLQTKITNDILNFEVKRFKYLDIGTNEETRTVSSTSKDKMNVGKNNFNEYDKMMC